jgi:hypothetical protein
MTDDEPPPPPPRSVPTIIWAILGVALVLAFVLALRIFISEPSF